MEPHMIDFVELASLGCNELYSFLFVIEVNHVGFMIHFNFFLIIDLVSLLQFIGRHHYII
jgi:hypothetical protein